MELTDMGKTLYAAVLVLLMHLQRSDQAYDAYQGNSPSSPYNNYGSPAASNYPGYQNANPGFGGQSSYPSGGSMGGGYNPSGGIYPNGGGGGYGQGAGGAPGGVQFPQISCPNLFSYQFDPNYGGWYGQVTTPKTNKLAQEFDVEVNMTVNKQVQQNENIKLVVMSGNDEIFHGDQIKWAVKFPFQDVLPKIIQVKFNGQVICTNPGDPLTTGVVQTSMWAKATIKTSNSPSPGGQMPGVMPGGYGGVPMGNQYGGYPYRKSDEDSPPPNDEMMMN